jgi:hypothetical protein
MRSTILTALLAASLAVAGPDVIWQTRLDFGMDEMAWGVDSRGPDVAATGYFTDTTLTAGCLTVKLNQSGDTVWSRTFTTELDDYGLATCLDAEGGILVAGYSYQVFGPRPARLVPSSGFQDYRALVLKYDAEGELKWSRVLPGYGALGVAVDDSGTCYVSGMAGDPLISSDFWYAGFSATGDSLWSRTLDCGLGDVGYRAAWAPGTGLVFAGLVMGIDSACGVVVRVGPGGDTLWTRGVSAGSHTGLLGISIDPEGSIVASGTAADSLGQAMLTAKYDSAGGCKWWDTLAMEYAQALGTECDSAGSVYVAGISGAWPFDALAVKYSPEGETLWTVRYPGYEDEFYEVACDNAGNPVFAGRVSDGSYSDFLVVKYTGLAGIAESNPGPAQRAAAGVIPARSGFALCVPAAGSYRVSVCDLAGRQVRLLHSGWLDAGTHRFPVTALPAGAYVIRIESPGRAATALRAVLVR